MKKLHIDTSSNERVLISLITEEDKKDLVRETPSRKNQLVLLLIQELLQEQKIDFSDITEISVIVGPGSFTGVRVGVTIANTLGTLLQIPINDQKVGKLVEPVYE